LGLGPRGIANDPERETHFTKATPITTRTALPSTDRRACGTRYAPKNPPDRDPAARFPISTWRSSTHKVAARSAVPGRRAQRESAPHHAEMPPAHLRKENRRAAYSSSSPRRSRTPARSVLREARRL